MKTLASIALKEREKKAIEEAVAVLKACFEVEAAVLFGSKARGDDDRYSDLDLLVITGRPLHWKEEKAAVDLLFDVGRKHDVISSPLFVSSEEWNGGQFTEFPVYREILRDGAAVAVGKRLVTGRWCSLIRSRSRKCFGKASSSLRKWKSC